MTNFNAFAAAARYKGVQIQTNSPALLLVMLYDGAIRFVGEAQTAMVARDRARAGERIGRAQAIIMDLAATLDPGPAPELAQNLLDLYSFCRFRLLEANLRQDPKLLGDVVAALTPLREGFAAAEAESRKVA